jgi:DNA helicase-2/ATP-dependent DNA helicase PcrA
LNTLSLLDNLNPEQLAAVTLDGGSALILAGAGSGKTRVLTTRIAWLIVTGQVSPLGIMAVTFTNKAAKEMLARLTAMLPINTRGMWVGTFHGLAHRLLRTHYREANLPQTFQILDSQDQLSAIKRTLKTMGLDTEKFEPRKVRDFINMHKEAGLRAKDAEAFDSFSRALVEVFVEYDAQCQREGVADFAELLLRSFELLARNEPLREHYRARFSHILIDEFQDTNKLQYRWLKLFAGPHAALFAVGDDDQSIYAFRGAHTANMTEFSREFAGDRIVKLERNYRSHGNILDAANALIARNSGRMGKNLWTDAGAGEPIRVFQGYSDHDEASFIVDEVRHLHHAGAKLSDMALLYRSNAQSRVLEHALFTAGIAYRVYGGLRFFERAEIKHTLAYLRLIANPDDDTAFLRVVNFPTRGIGSRGLEALADAAKSGQCSLWQAACGVARSAKTDAFVALIQKLMDTCRDLTLPEQIEQVVAHSGLEQHYKNEKEGAERLENLQELVNAGHAYLAEIEHGDMPGGEEASADPLVAFLTHAALEAGEHQAEAGRDALQLMTVHAAKGLEFHAVFITGVEEGLFPHENSATQTEGLEEERRLMYVAITRARRRLYITHAGSRMLHGQVRYGVPSRFLTEIPPKLLRLLNDKVEAPRATAFASSGARAFSAPRETRIIHDGDEQTSTGGFKVGQNVTHQKFGGGVIVGCEGQGSDARVQVRFRDAGVKWLSLAFAKLNAA